MADALFPPGFFTAMTVIAIFLAVVLVVCCIWLCYRMGITGKKSSRKSTVVDPYTLDPNLYGDSYYYPRPVVSIRSIWNAKYGEPMQGTPGGYVGVPSQFMNQNHLMNQSQLMSQQVSPAMNQPMNQQQNQVMGNNSQYASNHTKQYY